MALEQEWKEENRRASGHSSPRKTQRHGGDYRTPTKRTPKSKRKLDLDMGERTQCTGQHSKNKGANMDHNYETHRQQSEPNTSRQTQGEKLQLHDMPTPPRWSKRSKGDRLLMIGSSLLKEMASGAGLSATAYQRKWDVRFKRGGSHL